MVWDLLEGSIDVARETLVNDGTETVEFDRRKVLATIGGIGTGGYVVGKGGEAVLDPLEVTYGENSDDPEGNDNYPGNSEDSNRIEDIGTYLESWDSESQSRMEESLGNIPCEPVGADLSETEEKIYFECSNGEVSRYPVSVDELELDREEYQTLKSAAQENRLYEFFEDGY